MNARACAHCAESLRAFGWLCPRHAGREGGARRPEAVEAVRRAKAAGVALDSRMRDVKIALETLARRS